MTCEFWFLETKTQISSYEYEITAQIRILIHFIFPKLEQIRKNVSFNTLVDQNKSFLIQWPVQMPEIEVQFFNILNFRCLSDRFLYSLSCLNFRWLVRPILKKRIHFAKRMLDWDAVLFVQGQFHNTNISRIS